MISVAMTTYNGERYVVEQLESILNQTLYADEVVICDDCSTDKTITVIRSFIKKNNLEKNWHLYQNEKSIGFIQNFIKAISLTTGEFIFLADQDDIFYPKKFELMVNFFSKYSDCVLLNANFEMIDESSQRVKTIRSCSRFRGYRTKKLNFSSWLYESSFPGFSMCFKSILRDKLNEIQLENCYGHDQLLSLMAIDRNGNYSVSTVLSGYRIHQNNTTSLTSIVTNFSIFSRIDQKNKELNEYFMLKKFLMQNQFNYINFSFLEMRMSELQQRINILKNKQVIPIIKLLFCARSYPKYTLLGDFLYILKQRKEKR